MLDPRALEAAAKLAYEQANKNLKDNAPSWESRGPEFRALKVAELEGPISAYLKEADGWRTDMENAPRDGTPILIWQPDCAYKNKWFRFDDNRYAIGYWRVGEDESWGNRNSATVRPTHWLPLPPPPINLTEGG